MSFIEFHNTSFSYDGSHNALADVTLNIEEGSFTCVVGGNGSGKSTLARHMNALLVPTSGSVCVAGLDTAQTAHTTEIRQLVGMVFQNPDDQIVASIVEDDVAFGPENLGLPSREIKARVDEALDRMGMQDLRTRQTAGLSSGQKQRVSIAGALAMKPRALVLDEPGSTLDPIGRRMLMDTCHKLNREGMTIVLITHFMEEAATADRVIALEAGRIALDGQPEQVLTQTALLESLGLEAPAPARISEALQAQGLDIRTHIDEQALVDDVAAFIRNRTGL